MNSITITKVENGWIVMLPTKKENQLSKSFSVSIKKIIQELGKESDPLLSSLSPKIDEEEEDNKIDTGIHVFTTFKEVLEFLNYRNSITE